MNQQNLAGLSEFEGYSPAEMNFILYDTFGENSPIELCRLNNLDYVTIPILNQIKYMAELIKEQGEIKLTKRGFLPTKIVADIYTQGFLNDGLIDSGTYKLYKELDSMSIHLCRLLLELVGITKKRNGKLSLTKKGVKLMKEDYELLRVIFETFGSKLNWAYFDGYGENNIGQLGYGFTLILLSKYGSKKHHSEFYAEKYFKAFPRLLQSPPPTLYGPLERPNQCYSTRIFSRFLDFFGIINFDKKSMWDDESHVWTTELFDKLIKCKPPKNRL